MKADTFMAEVLHYNSAHVSLMELYNLACEFDCKMKKAVPNLVTSD